MSKVWSSYQQAIFADFRSGIGATAIDATPGSGKSTSIVEGLNHLPAKTTNVLMTSFSKQSVEDLKAKDPPWFVEVKTMNSLGNKALRQSQNGNQQLKLDRVYTFMDKVLGPRPEDPVRRATFNGFRSRIKALVDMSKAHLVDDADGMLEVADNMEIDTITPDWIAVELAQMFGVAQEDTFVESARLVLDKCKEIDGTIDFNDQIWLPVIHDLPMEQFEAVIVDEAQDTSIAQMELLIRSAKKGSRIIMAGENAQAIYAWRGAGLGMEPFIARTQAKILPLSISYRCPKAIVAEAAKIVPGIQTAPDAPEGRVSTIPRDLLPLNVRVGDTILSRKNAPLISIFMDLLGRGIPVGMVGRNIGESILRFIDKSQAFSAGGLLDYTNEWAKLEIERRKKKNPNAKIDHIDDHVRCVHVLCEVTDSVRSVIDNVNKLLRMPEGDKVLLSTVHRAKGLEWPKVFLIRESFPSLPDHWLQYARKANKQAWANERAKEVLETDIGERNVLYVGLTRAKEELIYVTPIGDAA